MIDEHGEDLPESVRGALAEVLRERTDEFESFLGHPFLLRVRAFCRGRARAGAALILEDEAGGENLRAKLFRKLMLEVEDGKLWRDAYHAGCADEAERLRREHEYLDRGRAAAAGAADAAAGASGLLGPAGGAAGRADSPYDL